MGTLAPGDLVDFVDEDDAALLDSLDGGPRDGVHVDQLLLLVLDEVLCGLGHLEAPLLGAPLKQPGQHVLDVDVDFFDRRATDDLERRKGAVSDVDLDHAVVEAAESQLLAKLLARARGLVPGRLHHGCPVRRRRGRHRRRERRQEQVEEPLLGVALGLLAHLHDPLFTNHRDCEFDDISHHRLDIATNVAHLGELGGFHLQKRRLGQPREPPGDLGLADAGRSDHQDVLGRYLVGEFRRQLLAPNPAAECNRDRSLRTVLSNDVAVELGNDLTRRQGFDGRSGARRQVKGHRREIRALRG